MASNPHESDVLEEKACRNADADCSTCSCRAHHRSTIWLNDIRERAHQKWEAAGKPDGDNSRFWLDAEQELLQGQ